MKLRIHRVAVLLIFLVTPSALFAQAPAGVARVDSETYFDNVASDEPFSQPSYSTAEDFGSNAYGGQVESSWDKPGFLGTSASHGGLLGKTYVQNSFTYQGVNDDDLSRLDNSITGWDVEFNTPIPWVTSDEVGVDFFTLHEQIRFSGSSSSPAVTASVDENQTTIGGRIYAMPKSRFRPYAALGLTFANVEASVSDAGGSGQISESGSDFVLNLGAEFDLAANATLRADFELDRNTDIEEPKLETLLIVWPHENVFIRGGLLVPLKNGDFGAGATVGGGLAF
ncbi:MAG: outer membrane beta-barrel protein [Rhodopirellula sp.]|nr:outer membrane beta-barrel protein [Rhodopirellula sp.]